MTEDRTDIDRLVLVLETARKRILDPQHWIKDYYARSTEVDEGGEAFATSATSAYAACWCAEGAVMWAVRRLDESHEAEGVSVDDAKRVVCEAFNTAHSKNFPHLHVANDAPETTHEMMITAFDHAIRELG